MSAIGIVPEAKVRKTHGRRVREETVYSIRTQSYAPVVGRNNMGFKSTGSTYVAQRVLSAKVLRVKELQNELQQVKNQLYEVINENKLLRNLQKRQDTALARYEDSSAALPRLLENHRAEVNTLKTHAREVRAAARSLHRKLQRSETDLFALRDQYNKLKQVAEDRDLDGRVELQKRIEDLEDRLRELREKNLNLSRKLEVEQKSHNQQMAAEVSKRKNLCKELQTALNEVAKLNAMLDLRSSSSFYNNGGNTSRSSKLKGPVQSIRKIPRPTKECEKEYELRNPDIKTNEDDAVSTGLPELGESLIVGVNMTEEYINKAETPTKDYVDDLEDWYSEVPSKLSSDSKTITDSSEGMLSNKHSATSSTSATSSELPQPSSRYTKTTKNNLTKVQDHLNQIDDDFVKYLNERGGEFKDNERTFENYVEKLEEINQKEEPESSQEAQKLNEHFKSTSLEGISDSKYLADIDESYKFLRSKMDADNARMNEKLQKYCEEVSQDVKDVNDAIDLQKTNLEFSRRETALIKNAVKINENLNDQIKFSTTRIDLNKKNQLLATLKAIDSGKTLPEESISSRKRMNKSQLMKELFDT